MRPDQIACTFIVELAPKPKNSRRAIGSRVIEDPRFRSWEAAFCVLAAPHRPPVAFEGPLALVVMFVRPRPKRLSSGAYPPGLISAETRPDLDNLVKGVKDGLTKLGFWRDDAQIVTLRAHKFYAEEGGRPRIEIAIGRVDGSKPWMI